jgi:hypothetical protein
MVNAMLHPRVRGVVIVVSVLMFVGSLIGVPWLIVRLPVRYFDSPEHPVRTPLGWVVRIGRNAAGAVLFVLGVAMLVLPGQGLLAMLAGLMLMEFPGKRRLERRVMAFPRVFRTVNALRRRAGRAPFEIDPHAR